VVLNNENSYYKVPVAEFLVVVFEYPEADF